MYDKKLKMNPDTVAFWEMKVRETAVLQLRMFIYVYSFKCHLFLLLDAEQLREKPRHRHELWISPPFLTTLHVFKQEYQRIILL